MVVVLVLWASAFIAIRAVGDAISPGPLALGRQLVGVLVLVVVAAVRRPPLPRGRTLVLVAVYGVLWFAGYTLVLNLAERHLDAGTAAMLVNIAPLLVAVAAGAFLKEGFPRSLMVGMVIAFAGVVIIATGGIGAHSDPLGIALGVLAAVLYASGVLVQKVALRTADALSATWVGCAVGAAVLLPFLPQAIVELGVAPAPAVWAMVYLGVFPTAVGVPAVGVRAAAQPGRRDRVGHPRGSRDRGRALVVAARRAADAARHDRRRAVPHRRRVEPPGPAFALGDVGLHRVGLCRVGLRRRGRARRAPRRAVSRSSRVRCRATGPAHRRPR